MVSVTKHKRGGYYMEVRPTPGVRKSIYLGKITKALAEQFKANIVRLLNSQRLNINDHEIIAWVGGIDPALRDRLAAAGLTLPDIAKPWLVGDWIKHVTNTYPGKDRTRANLETARKHWDGYIGNKLLSAVTQGDVRLCVERILASTKQSHGVRLCERGRMFFERAIEHKLIDTNPFTGLKFGGKRHDKSRQSYVTLADTATIIDKAASIDASALIALARYCGLRVPSEPLALRWCDVDWELHRLRIPSDTKTGERTLPLFSAYKYLRDLSEQAETGSTYIFNRARASAATTWRQWLETAINAAKIKQWEKVWVNLRASCRTDLEDQYPSHVCDAWLGHSSRVAKDHYSMVSPDHWAKASRTGANDSALSSALGATIHEVPTGAEQTHKMQETSE